MNAPKTKPLITWQRPMKRVLYALVPLTVTGVYFFGWRALVIVVAANLGAFVTELMFCRIYFKIPVTSAVFVTGTLLALTLPPTIPIWIAVLAGVVAITFGKMAFGGFGRNVFNPALVGRAFVYVSFGVHMTSRWVEPFTGFPGGFGGFAADAVSGATPLVLASQGEAVSVLRLLLGNTAGSLGATSAALILLGGAYLIWKKAANWRTVLSCALGMAALQTVFWLVGVREAADPLSSLVSGGFCFGLVFMATDPVSSASTSEGRWIYGALIGILTALIRTFSIWPEGIMFAILLGNMFAPIIDYAIRQAKSRSRPGVPEA